MMSLASYENQGNDLIVSWPSKEDDHIHHQCPNKESCGGNTLILAWPRTRRRIWKHGNDFGPSSQNLSSAEENGLQSRLRSKFLVRENSFTSLLSKIASVVKRISKDHTLNGGKEGNNDVKLSNVGFVSREETYDSDEDHDDNDHEQVSTDEGNSSTPGTISVNNDDQNCSNHGNGIPITNPSSHGHVLNNTLTTTCDKRVQERRKENSITNVCWSEPLIQSTHRYHQKKVEEVPLFISGVFGRFKNWVRKRFVAGVSTRECECKEQRRYPHISSWSDDDEYHKKLNDKVGNEQGCTIKINTQLNKRLSPEDLMQVKKNVFKKKEENEVESQSSTHQTTKDCTTKNSDDDDDEELYDVDGSGDEANTPFGKGDFIILVRRRLDMEKEEEDYDEACSSFSSSESDESEDSSECETEYSDSRCGTSRSSASGSSNPVSQDDEDDFESDGTSITATDSSSKEKFEFHSSTLNLYPIEEEVEE